MPSSAIDFSPLERKESISKIAGNQAFCRMQCVVLVLSLDSTSMTHTSHVASSLFAKICIYRTPTFLHIESLTLSLFLLSTLITMPSSSNFVFIFVSLAMLMQTITATGLFSKTKGEVSIGDATYYNPGPGSCGFTNAENEDIVAMNYVQMENGNVDVLMIPLLLLTFSTT